MRPYLSYLDCRLGQIESSKYNYYREITVTTQAHADLCSVFLAGHIVRALLIMVKADKKTKAQPSLQI